MKSMPCINQIEVGRYKHYKGHYYDVYCIALDSRGSQFVLYKQCYGDKGFWIRPYQMFFGDADIDGEKIPRFSVTKSNKCSVEKRIQSLIQVVKEQILIIKDSESNQIYCITNIDDNSEYILVHPLHSVYSSGYLTEFEIAERMGYISCRINGSLFYHKYNDVFDEEYQLSIGDNHLEHIKKNINPCSIDLRIAESGYLCTRRKIIDPQSIEHISSATELWKKVKIYRSKDQSSTFIKLYPGKTILTHTQERIHIPKDCAGKIEIKSTFARLSLSITSGDFCNPGYNGYFPFEISNNGKHTIIIHKGEAMAQLMLIPLQGPILEDYSSKATHKNEEGYDDGTPYAFWRERSLKALRKETGTQQLIDLFQHILNIINSQNTDDINGFRNRFSNNFLPFCQKCINKQKYHKQDSELPDTRKILDNYVRKEKRLKTVFNMKWLSGSITLVNVLLPVIIPYCISYLKKSNLKISGKLILSYWPFFVIAGIFLVLTFILITSNPKVFCTFEGIDLDEAVRNASKSDQ